MGRGRNGLDALTEGGGDSPLYSSFSLNNVVLMGVQVWEIDTRRGTINGCRGCVFVVIVLKAHFFRSFFTNGDVRSRGRISKVYLKVNVLWVF